MSSQGTPSGHTGPQGEPGTWVEPGNKTGCYYIIISGLHRTTTWKDVKDFLRLGGVEMDNVEVFPDTQSGWVRVYGQDSYYKAMQRFRTAPCKGKLVVADGSNILSPVFVRNYTSAPLQAANTSAAGPHAQAFSSQIPPLSVAGQPNYMPKNVSVSYTNPYTNPHTFPSKTTSSFPQDSYDQSNYEWYNTHPTRFHAAPPAQRTGYEGTQQYAAASAAFVDARAGLSAASEPPAGTTSAPATGSADFRITVKRDYSIGPIDQDIVTEFVRVFAPLALGNILRIDILRGRGKHRGPPTPPSTAVIVFNDARVCEIARNKLFESELNGVRMVMGPSRGRVEEEVEGGASETGKTEGDAEGGGKAEGKKQAPPPSSSNPTSPSKSEGGNTPTRKDKNREMRKQYEEFRKAGGSAHYSSFAAARRRGREPPSAGQAQETNPLVVDGTSGRHQHQKHRHEGRRRHK